MTEYPEPWEERRFDDLMLHARMRKANSACVDYEVRALVVYDDGVGDYGPIPRQGCRDRTRSHSQRAPEPLLPWARSQRLATRPIKALGTQAAIRTLVSVMSMLRCLISSFFRMIPIFKAAS